MRQRIFHIGRQGNLFIFGINKSGVIVLFDRLLAKIGMFNQVFRAKAEGGPSFIYRGRSHRAQAVLFGRFPAAHHFQVAFNTRILKLPKALFQVLTNLQAAPKYHPIQQPFL